MFAMAFRLFVSSTFQDFGEERRLLQERVFPALEEHCAKEGFGFRAVDMRWGVNDDAQLNQRTAEICLGEVIDAKSYPAPNLLILIGDRYGWVPLPFAIARDEFEAMRAWLSAQGHNDAVSILDLVYALDENHLAPCGLIATGADLIGAYTLRSREDDLSELKAPEAWAPVEALLRDALQAAARNLHAQGQLRDEELGKHTLSLTEQEVRKGLEQLAEGDGAAAANLIAWARTTKNAEPPVQALAEVVKHALPKGHVLHAPWHAESAGYGEHFVEQITAKLLVAIDGQIADFKARAQAPDFALQTERAIHAAFAAERLRVFVGRESNLAAIAMHIASDARHPLVLTGISGSGKTALMARAAAEAGRAVVQRYVGASASSASQRGLLISVIEDLAALGVASLPTQWEDDDNRFVNQVRDLLARLDQPVAIFIDALDQLRAPYRPMWLPPQLHPKVKLIVSVLDDEAFAAERNISQGLRRNLPAGAFLTIEPLSAKDGADILAGLKREAQCGLSPDQEAFILERFEAAGASPLYLRIAFAIARRWRSTDDPRARGLAGDVTALVGQFLDELSSVHHHEPLLVRRALGLIAAGREGLSETEAIAVLSRDAEVMAAVSSERFGAKTDRLPDSVWVRLKRSLAALLVEKGEGGEPLISFFHRQVREVVSARFYEPDKAALHAALAAYFDPPAERPNADPPWTRRAFIELPFQLFHGGMRERLDALLTDPAWIDLKVQAFAGARETIEDYQQLANPADPVQALLGRSLRLTSGILERDPRQVMVQMKGRLPEALCKQYLTAVFARIPNGSLFELSSTLSRPQEPVARLDFHESGVRALAVSNDGGLVSASLDGTIFVWEASHDDIRLRHQRISKLTVTNESGFDIPYISPYWTIGMAVLSSGHIATAYWEDDIHIVDLQTGKSNSKLVGHQGRVQALVTLPDGRLASGSDDGSVRLWDPTTGQELGHLLTHTGQVKALALGPHDTLVIGTVDGLIHLRSLSKGEVKVLRVEGVDAAMLAVGVLPDGSIAAGHSNGVIIILDSGTGLEHTRIHSPHGEVHALSGLQAGLLASGGRDAKLLLWDCNTGEQAACLVGHSSAIRSLTQLPGGLLASASDDHTICLWRIDDGLSSVFSPHGSRVVSLTTLPSGLLVSSSTESLVVWDVYSQAQLQTFAATEKAFGIVVGLSDGRLAIASGKWEDGSIYIWDREQETEMGRLERKGMAPSAMMLLENGTLAIEAAGNISIWDVVGCQRVASRRGAGSWTSALAQLTDGRIASAGLEDGTVLVFDPEDRERAIKIQIDSHQVSALLALPDRGLAVGSSTGAISIWNAEATDDVINVGYQQGRISAMAITTDGLLAIGSTEKVVSLWDLQKRAEVSRIEFDGEITELIALRDNLLVAGDALGRLHWLAIKGTEARAQGEPGVRSVAKAATGEALSDAGSARLEALPAACKPRATPPKHKGRGCHWAFVILMVGLSLAAAILLGPALGLPQAREAWDAAMALLGLR